MLLELECVQLALDWHAHRFGPATNSGLQRLFDIWACMGGGDHQGLLQLLQALRPKERLRLVQVRWS